MNNSRDRLSDDLLSLEQVDSELHRRYEEEIEKMFTEKITPVRKLGWCSRDLFLLLFGLALTGSAIFNQPIALPPAARWLWGISGAFTLLIAVLGFRLTGRKSLDLRKDPRLIASVASTGMTVVGFAVILIAFLTRNLEVMATLTPIAMLILVIGILIGVDNRVQQGELNTREKLLEIEYRLAALDERLGGGGKK